MTMTSDDSARRIAVLGDGELAAAIASDATDAGHAVLRAAADGPVDPAGLDLVIEATGGAPAARAAALERVAATAGDRLLLATTIASGSVTAIAAATGAAERCGGLHFPDLPGPRTVVEVVAGERTAPDVAARLAGFVRSLGRTPVPVRDRPGLLIDGLLRPYLNQALRAYDEGIATPEDIDAALRLGLGYPLGPLELLDRIGLDHHLAVTSAIHAEHGGPDFAPPPVLDRLVAAGRIGERGGQGIHDHDAQRDEGEA